MAKTQKPKHGDIRTTEDGKVEVFCCCVGCHGKWLSEEEFYEHS